MVALSAATGRNLEAFQQAVVQRLEIMRVYSKSPGKTPDLSSPFTLKKGSTVADFAARIHRDFVDKFKAARVWGTSVYDGQMVQRDYVLQDGDVVELQI
jgi:ribosome-interacting GTPase 1